MSRERDERILSRAYKLARSGDYLGWSSIEGELRMEFGHRRPRDLLEENERLQDRLDRLCAEARRDEADA